MQRKMKMKTILKWKQEMKMKKTICKTCFVVLSCFCFFKKVPGPTKRVGTSDSSPRVESQLWCGPCALNQIPKSPLLFLWLTFSLFPYFLTFLTNLEACKILPTLDSAFWHMRTFHDVPWLQNASDAMLKKSTAPCVLLICGFCVSTNKSWPLEGNAGNANPCDCISSSREPHPGIRRPSLWSVQSWITFVPLCPLRFHVQMMQQLWRPLRHCFSDAGRWWRLARFA